MGKFLNSLAALSFLAGLTFHSAAAEVGPRPKGLQLAISGIRIGQSPAASLKSLKSEGYRITSVVQSASFRQRLADARNAELRVPSDPAKSTEVSSVLATQADQHIRINYDDDATGARVASSIHFDASSVAHPFGHIRATLINRYGPPQAEDGTGSVWCTGDQPNICLAHGVRGNRLKVGHDYRGFDPASKLTTIELVAGDDLRKSWRDGFRGALSRLVKSKNAF